MSCDWGIICLDCGPSNTQRGEHVHWFNDANHMCPAGKHGLDFEGQHCDLCATATEATP